MAYCRCGGKDSDIYVWCGINYNVWFCLGQDGVIQRMVDNNLYMEKDNSGYATREFETAEETFNYIIELKKMGFKVPQYAIASLGMEFK